MYQVVLLRYYGIVWIDVCATDEGATHNKEVVSAEVPVSRDVITTTVPNGARRHGTGPLS